MLDQKAAFVEHARTVLDSASQKLSEADTRSYLIDPVLRLLGYDSLAHLRREVPVPATKETLDYELLIDGQPTVVVEAKSVSLTLTDQHAAQCVQGLEETSRPVKNVIAPVAKTLVAVGASEATALRGIGCAAIWRESLGLRSHSAIRLGYPLGHSSPPSGASATSRSRKPS